MSAAGDGSGAGRHGGRGDGLRSSLPLQLRFSDADGLGHVNNAVFATLAELGRVDMLKRSAVKPPSLILARLAIDYRSQVKLTDDCRIDSWVVAVGNSSFTVRQELHAAGRLAAEFEAVVVCFDYQTQRPLRVPDDLRGALLGAVPPSAG